MLTFYNNSKIDAISIKTFGVNAKENDSAIGYFGTGLKYAIAVILRNGGKIRIQSHGELYSFTLKQTEIRGKQFTIVLMNGEPMGFTTELGENWELWMAYRELYCNATDEGGGVHKGAFEALTEVVVEGLDEIYDKRCEYFIHTAALCKAPGVEIHPGTPGIFYKGVFVGRPVGMLYRYNFTSNIKLSEDRQLVYDYLTTVHLADAIAQIADKDFIRNIITSPNDFERRLTFSRNTTYSPEFLELVTEAVKAGRNIIPSLYNSFRHIYDEHIFQETSSELNPRQRIAVDRGLAFLREMGYYVGKYEILTGNLGEDTLGMAKDGKIYLSDRVFLQGVKQVTATLLEEYLHLEYKLEDETYKMQTFLFDLVIDQAERAQNVVL